MANRFFLIALFAFSIISCRNELRIKEAYFDSGKLQSKSFFHAKKDTVPFKKIMYNIDGIVTDTIYYNRQGKIDGKTYSNNINGNYEKWSNFKNGLREGLNCIKFSNGTKIIRYWKNDSINGVQYTYDSRNRLVSRLFWINSKPLYDCSIEYYKPGDTIVENMIASGIETEKLVILQDSLILHNYYNLVPKKKLLGSLSFNKNGILKGGIENNSYAVLNLKDTIYQGDSLEVTIVGHFGNLKKLIMKMDFNRSNIDNLYTNNIYSYEGKPGELAHRFSIPKSDIGYNIIGGKITLINNKAVLETIFVFDDYFVLSRK